MKRPSHSRPARVLFVEQNEDGSTGGSHRSQHLVVKHLDRDQVDPIVAYYQPNPFVDRLEELNIPVYVLEAPRQRERSMIGRFGGIGTGWALLHGIRWRRDLLQRERIDLVHLNNSVDQGVDTWLPAAKSLGIPVVTDVRGDAHGIEKWWRRRLARRFDRILPVSEYIRSSIEEGGADPDLMEVLYLGVDVEGWDSKLTTSREQVRRALGVGRDELLAVMVGNVRRWKGQHVIAEAFVSMDPEDRTSWHIAFAGKIRAEDEAYREQVAGTFAAAGMSEQISFLGFRADVPDLLRASDVALHASTTPEPGGRAVLEALLSGTVVVAADKGGHTEYFFEPPQIGFLFPVEEPKRLGEILNEVARDSGLRHRVAAAARTRATEFSIQRTVGQLHRIYRDALGSE